MSDVEWDAEDYTPPPVQQVTDRWDGEDEEQNLKDSWDLSEDEGDSSQQKTTVEKKKKKKLADILAEKEKKRLEDLERRRKEKEEEMKNASPEAQLTEKLRLQKIQEDSDLALASDIMGVKDDKDPTELDNINLSSKDDLEKFRQALVGKIRATDKLDKKVYYVSFVEDLIRDLCLNMEMEDVKRVTAVLNAVYNEKVKANKPTKGKKKGGKATLNRGQGAISDDIDHFGYNEYDDFI